MLRELKNDSFEFSLKDKRLLGLEKERGVGGDLKTIFKHTEGCQWRQIETGDPRRWVELSSRFQLALQKLEPWNNGLDSFHEKQCACPWRCV